MIANKVESSNAAPSMTGVGKIPWNGAREKALAPYTISVKPEAGLAPSNRIIRRTKSKISIAPMIVLIILFIDLVIVLRLISNVTFTKVDGEVAH